MEPNYQIHEMPGAIAGEGAKLEPTICNFWQQGRRFLAVFLIAEGPTKFRWRGCPANT